MLVLARASARPLRRWARFAGAASLLFILLFVQAAAGFAAACVGDCDGDGRVTIGELVEAVNIALWGRPVRRCSAADANADGGVDIEELVQAVNRALAGCAPAAPTATPSTPPNGTATPPPAETSTPPPAETSTPPPAETPSPSATEPPTPTGTAAPPAPTPTPTAAESNVCDGVPTARGTDIRAVRVAAGLAQPLYATAPPGDTERLFVVEQSGRVRIVKSGALLATPFLDLRGRVATGGERGLLSLAFHPHYASNGRFFVNYTMFLPDGVTLVSIVSRFRVSAGDPDRADPDSEEIVLEQIQPYVAHNGGQLLFDAAGMLYVSFGDGGQSAVRQNTAQDPGTWLGKILRIDPDGGEPYAIPPDNPFAGPEDGVLDEIWASGFRNPWRVSIDPLTADLYIGDVGESTAEEIDVLPRGQAGANFGWCCREGLAAFSRCFQAATTCPADGAGLTPPVVQYGHDEGCSVTGGFVYRGCALPDLQGTYFYGDYCAGFVRSFTYRDGVAEDQHDWSEQLAPSEAKIDRIAGFGQDARGEIYICDFVGGEVYKIVPAS